MARRPTFRQMLLSILASWEDLSQKEIEARAGLPPKSLSQYLRRGDIHEDLFQRLLRALRPRPAAVDVVTECLEALQALETEDLTDEEKAGIEGVVLKNARLTREMLAEAVRRRHDLPRDDYPAPADLAAARREAGEMWERLMALPEEIRPGVVQGARQFQTWELCEKVCEESVRQLARHLPRAAGLAQLAQKIAEQVQGPEGWRHRVQGYAEAHVANVLRVSGELEAARAALERAKQLWDGGSDPAGVLDPGRLLDLEASLCRDQRRFDEALDRLDKALPASHRPGRILLNKGFTLEVMGEYQRAVEALLRAMPQIDRQAEPRQWNILRLNLANVLCHLGRHQEALELVEEVKPLIAEQGDEIDLIRVPWLEGRIAAGQGRREEALSLFDAARREFAARGMSYDVALALLEEALLLLEVGRLARVKVLAQELKNVFEAKGVHREALAALRLFQQAAEREAATAALARRVLHYLYRVRHNQGFPFGSL